MSRRKQKGKSGNRQRSGNNNRKPRNEWLDIVPENPKFTEYYKKQNVGVSEEEWPAFMKALATQLPTTFRITEGPFATEIKQKLEHDFLSKEKCANITLKDGTIVETPQPLPWYPENNGWYFKVSKREMRNLPGLEDFHQFLILQTANGNISRQEAVSMVPPLFMDVKPHHRILDMCAAPGSKTAQLSEALNREGNPSGIVIANDMNRERCYMLTHQIKRLTTPFVLITNHEAQNFPFIKVPATAEELSADTEGKTNDGKITFQFDRILADVPCSGDGAMRKIPDMWGRWTAMMGIGLHKLQSRIAIKGAKLLKVGGRMVYSTCSMNPHENEAVVAELLRSCGGALRLLDVSDQIPLLKRFPGITSWQVQHKNGKWMPKHEDVPNDAKDKYCASLFPPTDEEIAKFHLDRCMRFFPHVNDTGGFFVAVFEKISPIHAPNQIGDEEEGKETKEEIKTSEMAVDETSTTEVKENMKEELKDEDEVKEGKKEANKPEEKKKRMFSSEEPYLPIPEHMRPVLKELEEAFGIKENFPWNQLMCRSEKSPKLYFLAAPIRTLLENDTRGILRVVNTGVKLFVKHVMKDTQRTFRLSQDGLEWFVPFVTKRIVKITEQDFFILLEKKDPFFGEFSYDVQIELHKLEQGSLVFQIIGDCINPQLKNFAAAGWRGKVSCKLHMAKEEINSFVALATKAKASLKPQTNEDATNKRSSETNEDLPAQKKPKTENEQAETKQEVTTEPMAQ